MAEPTCRVDITWGRLEADSRAVMPGQKLTFQAVWPGREEKKVTLTIDGEGHPTFAVNGVVLYGGPQKPLVIQAAEKTAQE